MDVVGLATDGTMIEEIRWSPYSEDGEHECAIFTRNGFRQFVRDAAADRDDLKL